MEGFEGDISFKRESSFILCDICFQLLCHAVAFNFLRSHIIILMNAYAFFVHSRKSFPVLTSSRVFPQFLFYQI